MVELQKEFGQLHRRKLRLEQEENSKANSTIFLGKAEQNKTVNL